MQFGGATGGRRVFVPGHFGELLQGRLGPSGPVVLVTLPCAKLGVRGLWRPGRFAVSGTGLSPARARAFLADLGLPRRGKIRLKGLAPPGSGTGVSTAALVALARLAGWRGPVETLAMACRAAEGATDPLMFAGGGALLWASRAAQRVETGPHLPPCTILGGFWGPPLRTCAGDDRFADIADLVADWRQATTLASFAALASESAARNAALRGPGKDPTPRLAAETGALGWCAAHTGNARGLIFARDAVPAEAGTVLRRAGLRGVLRFDVGADRT